MLGGNIIKILFFLLLSVMVLVIDDYVLLGTLYFYFTVLYHAVYVIRKRKIDFINVWNGAFLFIILSEVFSDKFYVTPYHLNALQYLIIANNIIYIGYYSYERKDRSKEDESLINNAPQKTNKIVSFLIPVLILVYVGSKIQRAIYIFTVGRNIAYSENNVSGNILSGPVLSSLGLILPSIIAYYFFIIKGKSIRFIILYSSPIFLILFLNGTRFPLLFSILGFIYVIQSKYATTVTTKSLKKYYVLIVGVVCLFVMSLLMKQLRSSTTKDNELNIVSSYEQSNDLVHYIASYGSAEGVIDMTALMFDYFETREHLYGKSSSFLLYFWVPRSIWEDKPQMLGYWFVRKYRVGFSDAHSTSFGFTGDLYADFGWYSLILIFFMGRLLKYANYFKDIALKSKGYVVILGAMLFPYLFFFVRSPITATITFLGILFFYYLFKRLIFAN